MVYKVLVFYQLNGNWELVCELLWSQMGHKGFKDFLIAFSSCQDENEIEDEIFQLFYILDNTSKCWCVRQKVCSRTNVFVFVFA